MVLLVFFEVTAIVSGSVMSRMRTLMEASGQSERTTQLLYQIATGFLNCTGEKNILQQGIVYIREYAGRGCRVTLEGAENAQREERPSRAYSIPSAMGILGRVHVLETDEPLSDQDELVIKTVATQMGIALDREYVYHERENIRVAMERERLRSTLLRSVAHDLRSPLTALSGREHTARGRLRAAQRSGEEAARGRHQRGNGLAFQPRGKHPQHDAHQ